MSSLFGVQANNAAGQREGFVVKISKLQSKVVLSQSPNNAKTFKTEEKAKAFIVECSMIDRYYTYETFALYK